MENGNRSGLLHLIPEPGSSKPELKSDIKRKKKDKTLKQLDDEDGEVWDKPCAVQIHIPSPSDLAVGITGPQESSRHGIQLR